MNEIMIIVQVLEDCTTKNKTKEQKGGFLCMFLGTLGASLLGNLLAGKITVRACSGNKKGKGIVRAGTRKRLGFSMPSHSLTNLELERIYQNEPRFNGVFSRDNLP